MGALGDIAGALGPAAQGYTEGQLQGLRNAQAQKQLATENQFKQGQLDISKSELGLRQKQLDHQQKQDTLAVYSHLHDHAVADLHDPALRDTWTADGSYASRLDWATRLGNAIASGDTDAAGAVAGERPGAVAQAANNLGVPHPELPKPPTMGSTSNEVPPNRFIPMSSELSAPAGMTAFQPPRPFDLNVNNLLDHTAQVGAQPTAAGAGAAPGIPNPFLPAAAGGAGGAGTTAAPAPAYPPDVQKELDAVNARYDPAITGLLSDRKPNEIVSNEQLAARHEKAIALENAHQQALDRVIAPYEAAQKAEQARQEKIAERDFRAQQSDLERRNRIEVAKLVTSGKTDAAKELERRHDQDMAQREKFHNQDMAASRLRFEEGQKAQAEQRQATLETRQHQITVQDQARQVGNAIRANQSRIFNNRTTLMGLDRSLPTLTAAAMAASDRVTQARGASGQAGIGGGIPVIRGNIGGGTHAETITLQGRNLYATDEGKYLYRVLQEAQKAYTTGTMPFITSWQDLQAQQTRFTPQEKQEVAQLTKSPGAQNLIDRFNYLLQEDPTGNQSWRVARIYKALYPKSDLPPDIILGMHQIMTNSLQRFGVQQQGQVAPGMPAGGVGLPPPAAQPTAQPGQSAGSPPGMPTRAGGYPVAPTEAQAGQVDRSSWSATFGQKLLAPPPAGFHWEKSGPGLFGWGAQPVLKRDDGRLPLGAEARKVQALEKQLLQKSGY